MNLFHLCRPKRYSHTTQCLYFMSYIWGHTQKKDWLRKYDLCTGNTFMCVIVCVCVCVCCVCVYVCVVGVCKCVCLCRCQCVIVCLSQCLLVCKEFDLYFHVGLHNFLNFTTFIAFCTDQPKIYIHYSHTQQIFKTYDKEKEILCECIIAVCIFYSLEL